jgi:hypothetical protein
MNEKKFEKAIDVLLHQQAQLNADMTELKEDALKRLQTLERVSLNLYNVSVEQGKNLERLSGEVSELRDAQKETNDRLNAVIFMAEKFFGGNGKSKPKR